MYLEGGIGEIMCTPFTNEVIYVFIFLSSKIAVWIQGLKLGIFILFIVAINIY